MIVAAAVCPAAPVIVPALAAGAADELAHLRAVADRVVATLLAARPAEVVVVAGVPSGRAGSWPGDAGGTLAGYGVPLTVGTAGAPAVLPPTLAIGAWWLDRAGWAGRREYLGVDEAAPTADCLATGRALAGASDRRSLLVVADGSATRDRTAPGYLDERAVGYDAELGRALAAGDADALAGLDPALAAELLVGGRAALQVLAGAAGAGRAGAGTSPVGGARLLAYAARYGVSYFVAVWTLDHPADRMAAPD